MLKHAVSKHPEMHPNEVVFGMEILSQHKTGFERQLTETVEIRRRQGDKLMNSKQEYNRCYIPKIMVKIDENEKKNPEFERENRVKETIKMIRAKWKRTKNAKKRQKKVKKGPKNGEKWKKKILLTKM